MLNAKRFSVLAALLVAAAGAAWAQRGGGFRGGGMHAGGFRGGFVGGRGGGFRGGFGGFRGGWGSPHHYRGGYFTGHYGPVYHRPYYYRPYSYGYSYPFYGYGYSYPSVGFYGSFGYSDWPSYSYAPPSYVYEAPPYPVVAEQGTIRYVQPGRSEEREARSPGAPSGRDQYWLIAFRDDSIRAVTDYWTEGSTLHFVSRDGAHSSSDLARVDFVFTKELNRERGLEFRMPAPVIR